MSWIGWPPIATASTSSIRSRAAPPAGWQGQTRRVDRDMLAQCGFRPEEKPQIFVCGPTAFVETVADQLVGLGHGESAIKTERFGPTGETSDDK